MHQQEPVAAVYCTTPPVRRLRRVASRAPGRKDSRMSDALLEIEIVSDVV
jgi:hypothetical protein